MLFFLFFWFILFFYNDKKKRMLNISIIFGFVGIIMESFYIIDWWHPLTIFGTKVGVEDFIFGFTLAGISSAAYYVILKKSEVLK